jgi:hypothetical protein
MNSEEDEFRRIEAEALRRAAQDDDDTQVYAKPWVSLTDAEIWSAVDRIGTSDSDVNPYQILNNARAIEAALRSKNT